jgi:hypothetical protein
MISIVAENGSTTITVQGKGHDVAQELIAATARIVAPHHELAIPLMLGILMETGESEFCEFIAEILSDTPGALKAVIGDEKYAVLESLAAKEEGVKS